MKVTRFIPLVAIGALLGAGAHWLKSDAEEANRIVAELPQGGYQACQELNALLIKADKNEELRDCDAEYLE